MLKKLDSIVNFMDKHSIFIFGSVSLMELLWLLENKLKS